MEHEHGQKGVEKPVEYRVLVWVAIIAIAIGLYYWVQKQSFEHCIATEGAKGYSNGYGFIKTGRSSNCI